MENEKRTEYRKEVYAFLTRRRIKNKVGTLVWLRAQKAQKLEANKARADIALIEVEVLDEIITEAEEGLGVSVPSGLNTYLIIWDHEGDYGKKYHETLMEAPTQDIAEEGFKEDHPEGRILEVIAPE